MKRNKYVILVIVFFLILITPSNTSIHETTNNSITSVKENEPSQLYWMTGWAYRKVHLIDTHSAGENVQIRIIVRYGSGGDGGHTVFCDSNCAADFSDIRFTSNDGYTVLNQWCQEYFEDDRAVFWVDIPSSVGSVGIIYIYFGNAEAELLSNSSLFPLFDGFDRPNSDIVGEGWTEDQDKGSLKIVDNQLEIKGVQNRYCHVEQKSPNLDTYVLQARIKHDTSFETTEWSPAICIYWDSHVWIKFQREGGSVFAAYKNIGYGASGGTLSDHKYESETWVDFRIILSPTQIIPEFSVNDGMTWYSVPYGSRSTEMNGTPSLVIIGKGWSRGADDLWLEPDLDNSKSDIYPICTSYVDYVFASNYGSLTVEQGTWGPQEDSSLFPQIIPFEDLQFEIGTTGHVITWNASAFLPEYYLIECNGSVIQQGEWDGTSVTLDVDELDLGTNIVTLHVNSTFATSAFDTVIVTVIDTTPPTIEGPSDITYIVGSTDNEIRWNATDFTPSSYSIKQDGVIVEEELWDGGPIIINIDELDVGTYTYLLTIEDKNEQTASDEVIVNVVGSGIDILAIALIVGVAGVVAVSVIIFQKRRISSV